MKALKIAIGLMFCFTALAFATEKRTFPIPQTVSPELQAVIEKPFVDFPVPQNNEEWIHLRKVVDDEAKARLPALKKYFQVKSRPFKMANVSVYWISPTHKEKTNASRILLHLHGGGYVLFSGESATEEAIYVSGITGYKVVSVDYRLAPENPFPLALEDAFSVYRELLKIYPANKIGVFGSSAGGGLTVSLMLKIKEAGLPLPGAMVLGSPWSDLSKSGDSYFVNDGVDNAIGHYEGLLENMALLYAGGRDLKDPLLSPIYGDLKGLPPALLITGTRDLFLSNTVRMHTKLRQSGVNADLLAIEGSSHLQYFAAPKAPEVTWYYQEFSRFFDRHLF